MSYLVDRKHCKKGNLLYWWFHGKTHCPGYYTCCVIYWIYKFVRIVIYLSCFWFLFIFFFFNGLCFMFVYISNRKKKTINSLMWTSSSLILWAITWYAHLKHHKAWLRRFIFFVVSGFISTICNQFLLTMLFTSTSGATTWIVSCDLLKGFLISGGKTRLDTYCLGEVLVATTICGLFVDNRSREGQAHFMVFSTACSKQWHTSSLLSTFLPPSLCGACHVL